MATAEVSPAAEQDWGLSNPWPWIAVGAAASAGALLWARLAPDDLPGVRVTCLVAGVLAAAAALWLRFGDPGRAALDRYSPAARAKVTSLAALACVAVALAASGLLVAALASPGALPWGAAQLAVAWLLVAPWSVVVAVRLSRGAASDRADGAALCLLAAAVAFLASWALYLGEGRADEGDSMRLFFAGAALAALIASYVAGASDRWRRRLVSALIVYHLSGVVFFCLQHPPGPWPLQQLWMRLYRPYMEFMYLSNAYRFYAPEPTDATQLWCLVEYEVPGTKPLHVASHWVKLPDVDPDGRPNYPLALQYQRRLAVSENVARPLPVVPPLYVVGPDGRHKMAEHYRKRDDHSPFPQYREKLGHVDPANPLGIPYHPSPAVQQYLPPDGNSRQLLQSYARRLCREPHPGHPGLKATAVKIYRVLHRSLRPEELAAGADAHDPTLYLPYYVGKFDPSGQLLDPDDPFLYWIVPIRRQDPADPNSPILDYVKQHARGSGAPEVISPRGRAAAVRGRD